MTIQPPQPVTLTLRLRLAAAWAALVWERLWVRLWLTTSVAGFVLAVVLMDLLPALPGWLHIIALLAAVVGIGYMAKRALKGFQIPSWDAAQSRLEQTTSHRPLTTVQDTAPENLTAFQITLWRAHQERARTNLQNLKSFWPAPGVAAIDKQAIRAGAIIALFVAIMGSWGDMGSRFVRAAWPTFDDTTSGPSVKVWLTPPAYTGRSPIFVEWPTQNKDQPKTLEVAEGSKMLVVVTGTPRETTATVDDAAFKLEKLADKSQRLERDMPPRSDKLQITQRGRTLGEWNIDTIPDMPPSINFVREAREAGRWRLRLDYHATDDYGIESVKAHIVKPTPNPDPTKPEESIDFDLTVPPFNPKDATQVSLHDLTAHPWAGQPVLVQLIVTDQAGQSAPTNFQEVVLPERVFQHPIAKDLIAIRRAFLLAEDPKNIVVPAFNRINEILKQPQAFGGDPKVVLGLSTLKYRLAYDEAAPTDGSMPPILWASATRIEDGNLAVAEQRLEEAERALKEAMERGAPQEEISRLIDELQRAVAQYTKELASRMPEGNQALLNPGKDTKTMGPEDLMRMMQQMRQMNQMGAKDAAREMMADLQNMLQALKSMSNGKNDNPDVKAAQDIMRDLKALTGEQSKLLDDTFKQARENQLKQQQGQQQNSQQQNSQQGAQKQSGQQNQERASEAQEKLRQQLGELMARMAEATGQVPKSMGDAERNMRQARDALKAGAIKPASDAQSEALAKLQDSMGEANEELMQALEQKGMSGSISMPGDGETGNDPLGQRNGPNDENQVEVPTAPDTNSMAERVREILEEIRKRASDRTRPTDEQDYLRRLMKQF
jgi:uncharacterized protein (TIGR02302 family)